MTATNDTSSLSATKNCLRKDRLLTISRQDRVTIDSKPAGDRGPFLPELGNLARPSTFYDGLPLNCLIGKKYGFSSKIRVRTHTGNAPGHDKSWPMPKEKIVCTTRILLEIGKKEKTENLAFGPYAEAEHYRPVYL